MPLIDPPAAAPFARVQLAHVLALALALRLVALAIPAVAHPDEVFQYLETAHRLVFGTGVVTWEWRAGMRGWLLPLLVAAPMRLGALLAPAGNLYLVLPKLCAVAASLTTVAAAWGLGGRLSRAHGVAAALAAAIWYEGVYHAPHILSETASIAAILPAAALLLARERWSDRRLIAAGALLGLAASLRIQHLPAIAALVVAALEMRPGRHWALLLAGGIAGLVPSALADWAMGATPYGWVIENVRLNLVEHRAAAFGDGGLYAFARDNWPRWALWIVPALLLAGIGARRYPALAWVAAANLAVHLALTHKEYRFVLLSTTLVVLLAAIGSVDVIAGIAARRGAAVARERARLLALCWVLASASLALGGFRTQWTKFRPALDAAIAVRGDASVCGLAIYARDLTTTGGYAYLHRPIPLYYFGAEEARPLAVDLRAEAPRFDAILTGPAHADELPPGYAAATCEGSGPQRLCLYRRPGPCAPAAGSRYAIDAAMRRLDL